MRRFGIAAFALSLGAWSALAEEPTAPVAKAYEIDGGDFELTKGLMPWEPPSREALFSARLAGLFARDERYGREAHGLGLLGFDPLLNQQCCGVGGLKFKVVSRGEAKAVVEATFEGVGPQKVVFQTVNERGAWRIDEIEDRDAKGAVVSIATLLQGAHACGSDAGKPCRWPPQEPPATAVPGSPADLVRAIYKYAFSHVREPDSYFQAYSETNFRLRYFTAALRRAADGMDAFQLKYHGEILDFDPVLSSNGFPDPSGLDIRTASSNPGAALVVAAFGKSRERASVAYHLVRSGAAWRVDDLSSAPGATGTNVWSLRKLFDDALVSRLRAVPK